MISVAITSPLICETKDFPEVKIHELCTCTTSLVDQVNMTLATDFISTFDSLIENEEESKEDLFDNYFKYDFVKNYRIICSYDKAIPESAEINHDKLHNNTIKKSKSNHIIKKILSEKIKNKVKIIVKKEKEYYLVNGSWKFHYPKKC